MRRTVPMLLLAGLLLLPGAAGAGDAKPGQTPIPGASRVSKDVQDLIKAVTEAADRNPHTCFEEDGDSSFHSDPADRPQS